VRYDLIDLRLFLHVVAEGSITAGARRMHLSLPSASGRVRAFEHHAGVPLLIRGRRGVRLTPAGSALARHAREVLAHTARMESAVAGSPAPEPSRCGCWPAVQRRIGSSPRRSPDSSPSTRT
jgi:DNA-binding transcriptional LysR family regulator